MSDETQKPPTCTTCRFCLREDHGYSNWTPMGTSLYCLAKLNPALEDREEPWGEPTAELAAALDVALTCPSFTRGTPVHLDVDLQDVVAADGSRYPNPYKADHLVSYADSPEVRELLAAHLNKGRL